MWLSYGASLPPPLLLGAYSVRLLTRTTSLQRGPLETPIGSHRLHAPSPGLITVGGMGRNSCLLMMRHMTMMMNNTV